MADFTLQSFAAMLGGAVVNVVAAEQDGLEKAAVLVETAAKEVIGTYNYGWPQLAESTQADRVHQGFSANEPLLRTGEMQASIGHVVGSHEASVGSNEDKAVWQELGTSRGIPPRSFLAESARRKGAEVAEILGRTVLQNLVVGGPAFPHITPSTTPIP